MDVALGEAAAAGLHGGVGIAPVAPEITARVFPKYDLGLYSPPLATAYLTVVWLKPATSSAEETSNRLCEIRIAFPEQASRIRHMQIGSIHLSNCPSRNCALSRSRVYINVAPNFATEDELRQWESYDSSRFRVN